MENGGAQRDFTITAAALIVVYSSRASGMLSTPLASSAIAAAVW